MLTPTRSMGAGGKPFAAPGDVRRTHVRPPFAERYKPLPAPPLRKVHGLRSKSYMPAYTTFGRRGSMATSLAPVVALPESTSFQCAPPSLLRNTPRSPPGVYSLPMAAAKITRELDGSIAMRAMLALLRKPSRCQCLPPSAVDHNPSPASAVLRGNGSPVPT